MPFAQSGEAAIHWEEQGAGDPLLLIMGLGGSAQAWYRLLPHLGNLGQRVITFDNRGTGSSARVKPPLSLRNMVQDALAVLAAADVEQADVFGVSMGGMIAQHLALDHRARVRSLLLGCTTATARAGLPPWRLFAASGLRPISPDQALTLITPALYSRATREQHPERIREDFRVRRDEATSAHTVLAQMLAIAGHDVRARLHELDGLPVTVIHGSEDALVAPQRGRELAAGIPGARFQLIAGAGHLLLTDAEAEAVAAIRGHLDAVIQTA